MSGLSDRLRRLEAATPTREVRPVAFIDDLGGDDMTDADNITGAWTWDGVSFTRQPAESLAAFRLRVGASLGPTVGLPHILEAVRPP